MWRPLRGMRREISTRNFNKNVTGRMNTGYEAIYMIGSTACVKRGQLVIYPRITTMVLRKHLPKARIRTPNLQAKLRSKVLSTSSNNIYNFHVMVKSAYLSTTSMVTISVYIYLILYYNNYTILFITGFIDFFLFIFQ